MISHILFLRTYSPEYEGGGMPIKEETIKEDKDFGVFAVIPREILLNNELSSNDKLIYAVISGLSRGKRKECFARNEYFVKLFKISDRHVRRTLEKLAKLNLIIVGFRGKYRYIRITWKGLGGQ